MNKIKKRLFKYHKKIIIIYIYAPLGGNIALSLVAMQGGGSKASSLIQNS